MERDQNALWALGGAPPPLIRIYLVRHGQSEANLGKTVRLPDHRVELSPEGHRQAAAAGEYLAGALPREARIRILCSPYVPYRQSDRRHDCSAGWWASFLLWTVGCLPAVSRIYWLEATEL
jgi:Histidine phosphatase superfamily (branch 1)